MQVIWHGGNPLWEDAEVIRRWVQNVSRDPETRAIVYAPGAD